MTRRDEWMRAARAAFPHTLPVLTGFAFLGIAYGILMRAQGQGLVLTACMSVIVFAGSMQYLAAPLFALGFAPLSAFLLTLMVNARHLFYGISMLDRLRGTGKWKNLLIFLMCDETFSLLLNAQPPRGVDRTRFMVCIAVMDYLYWVLASVAGSLLGAVLTVNVAGIDFVLTALFLVIFLNQWHGRAGRWPAAVGVLCSLLCLAAFGAEQFMLPAMAAILAALLIWQALHARREAAQ